MTPEFLEWMSKSAPFMSLNVVYDEHRMTERFLDNTVDLLWWAWRSSRATVVVDLPDQCIFTNWQAYITWRKEQIIRLEAAGLKVAP